MKLFVLSAIFATVAVAKWTNASIEYESKLTCESCIRGGYEYCDFYSDDGTGKIARNSSSECFLFPKQNDTTITKPGVWNETGYFCSRWFLNKMNGIINQCTPQQAPPRNPYCGDYLIDLSSNSTFSRGIIIDKLAYNETCTYRVFSKCGYPAMKFAITNMSFFNSFDIAYTTIDGKPIE
jgi:hypothetical protein